MATDLDKLSKELELVKKREVDPHYREITNEREVTDPSVICALLDDSVPELRKKYSCNYAVAHETIVRAEGSVHVKELIKHAVTTMANQLALKMADDGYLIDSRSLIISMHTSHESMAEIVELICFGDNYPDAAKASLRILNRSRVNRAIHKWNDGGLIESR